ncbi:hypothetical protein ASPVEDRAFT_27246 [Aspergillus versicolor CBS 583.65]|uniref:Dickkopf N-terminal cysteine-rich domain-containing protein n=1 Tax=Aspergillus versicolor CBS 583.65 TaxID=1036611 RepID=A0A1L9PGB8_ASPVE|nr:uncharacterized protein ASPVEDRAFT_27246 [Aspergillus versicolor CBS 583.65]OJJ00523.1 hypothetical protein ASPVEDRAFT_27246 [Aspergillus versicolor CBS 583.65]
MKAYALLILLVSLAVAEITGAPSSNDPGDVGNTAESHSELVKRTGNGQLCANQGDCDKGYFCLMFSCIVDDPALFPDVLCRSNYHCRDKGPDYVCLNGLCAPPKPGPVDEPSCNFDSDCDGNAKCEGHLCINHDLTMEAPDISDPACKSDSDCDGGRCLNGICLAPSRTKLRFARRSPQLICHNDQECTGINGAPG